MHTQGARARAALAHPISTPARRDSWCKKESGSEIWIVVHVLCLMIRACEDGGLIEPSGSAMDPVSLEEFRNDPSGVFRSLHPCARTARTTHRH